jgi:glycerophosphoryl diester phosphodiesterase
MLINIRKNGQVRRKELRLIGHRGGRGFGPENTLQALRAAIDFGVEMIETDVRSSRDGVPVIHHSPFLGIHLLNHLNMSEIRQKAPEIPTLEEYLHLAAGKCSLNLEIKRCDVAILAEVMSWVSTTFPFLISSFDTDFLEDFKRTGFPAHTGLISQYDLDAARAVREAHDCGADMILPVSFYASESLTRAAHRAGLMVIPWTVNNTDMLQTMITMGVDGVITDYYEDFDKFLKSAAFINGEQELLNAG